MEYYRVILYKYGDNVVLDVTNEFYRVKVEGKFTVMSAHL